MTSLRTRLFAILVATTGLIWLCAAAWIYIQTKTEVEHVLDTRLQEAARMVQSLVANKDGAGSHDAQADPAVVPEQASYERQLSCQIWSLDGRLVARSSGAPNERLSDHPDGFSERVVDGETWRVYAIEDATKGIRVMVGDRLGLRERLVTDLIKGLLAPTLLIIPLLGLLIWTSLGRGLRPLQNMAEELQKRDAEDMRAIDARHAPREIRPVVGALNKLFEKVDAARRHEREVTAFAAHELRTPLAGLKTQAQIAMSAADPAIKAVALQQILISVDRTSRLVRQLLAVARLDARADTERNDHVNVGQMLEDVAAALHPTSDQIRVIMDPALYQTSLHTNLELLTVALRNLYENALQHMPNGGTARWSVQKGSGRLLITLEDEGPGIPDEELSHVANRFFRGRHRSTSGSGLGLAIVELALRRLNASLTLKNRSDRTGLRAEVSMEL
jgi:two-component system, OmpR family, sensor histidine kinase QseC